MQLSRDSIIAAALEILNEYGLADMTMRRVASQLSVAPGALYWHIANKQELINATAEQILRPALELKNTEPRHVAQTVRTQLLSFRDGAELATAALAQPSNSTRARLEELIGAALFDHLAITCPQVRAAGAAAIVHLTLGACTVEQNSRQYSEITGEAVEVPDTFTDSLALLLRGIERGLDSA